MSTDVVQNVPLPHVQIMMRDLAQRAIEREESGVSIQLQIMDQILSAETEEDLWRSQEAGTIAGKDFCDKPFLLQSMNIEWRKSRQTYVDQGGFPFYMMARVWDLDDECERVINCGGNTVVAMVWKLQHLKALDKWENGRPLVLRSNGGTESGFDYLTIHPAPVVTAPANGKVKAA